MGDKKIDVLGRPGTDEFVPRFFAPALVPGQRDNGTRIYFYPGTKGQRDVLSRIVLSLGNTKLYT